MSIVYCFFFEQVLFSFCQDIGKESEKEEIKKSAPNWLAELRLGAD